MEHISIVIPTLNSSIIYQTIESLKIFKNVSIPCEVIIVGRDDLGLIPKDKSFHFDCTERPYTPAEARNRGARQASGDILVFLDSDCVVHPDWLHKLTRHFQTGNLTGVGGSVRFNMNNYWNRADNFTLFHEFLDTQPAGLRKQLPSLNFAIQKEVFFHFGGFDERFPLPAGEDFDLTYRITQAGYSLIFDPEAWVMHIPARNSARALWQHSYKMGLYSTKIDSRYQNGYGLPGWLRNKLALRALSPALALVAALRVYATTPKSGQFWQSFPAVFLSKIAWCLGAANSPGLTGKL